jgi:hypothetical protein
VLYRRTNLWLADVFGLGQEAFDGPEHVMAMLERDLDSELESLGVG